MPSINELFAQKAHALTVGDIALLAEGFVTPTSIYIGDRIIYVRSQTVLVEVLARFRENLVLLGYTESRFINITQQIIGQRSVRVTLDWIDLGPKGIQISARETCFYCTRSEQENWVITLVNFQQAPEPALLLGLPVL